MDKLGKHTVATAALEGEERGLTVRACHEACHQVLYMYSVSVANVNIFTLYICQPGKGEYISLLLFYEKTFKISKCAPAEGAGNVYGGFESVFFPDLPGIWRHARGPNSLGGFGSPRGQTQHGHLIRTGLLHLQQELEENALAGS